MDPVPPDFEALFVAHRDDLLRYAMRRIGRQQAPDLVADTFAVALSRWRHSAPREPLPWLYAVAHNLLRNERRRAAAADRRVSLDAGLEVAAADAATEDRQLLVDAMRTLAADDREILFLAAWDGLEPRHIAVVLGCSAAAARVRLHRARRRLADVLRTSSHDTMPTAKGLDR